jgi:hypothetical protein
VKILASVLTLMGVVSMGNASFAMESGNCSKVIYRAAVQAAHQAEDGAAIVSNLRYAGSFQRSTGETEVNFYDYPYEVTVDVTVNNKCQVVAISERDNFRTGGSGN